MQHRAVPIFLSVTIWLIWSAVPARADSFCQQLQAIVADVPQGFAAIRREHVRTVPDDGGGDSAERFGATRWLPGATTCGVDDMRSDGDRIPSVYLCWFPSERSSAKAVTRIAHDVAACFDPGSARRNPAKVEGVTFDLQRKDFVLSLTAERDQFIVLAISGK